MDEMTASTRLEQLMRVHGDRLLRLCCVYLNDYALAQDAVQETFIKAYRHLDALRDPIAAPAWLTRIAINTCRSMRRSAWLRLVEPRESLPEAAQEMPEADALLSEIARLPVKYREVIILYYYQELSTHEAAQLLRIPEKTFSTRLMRARTRLRTLLERSESFEHP